MYSNIDREAMLRKIGTYQVQNPDIRKKVEELEEKIADLKREDAERTRSAYHFLNSPEGTAAILEDLSKGSMLEVKLTNILKTLPWYRLMAKHQVKKALKIAKKLKDEFKGYPKSETERDELAGHILTNLLKSNFF